MIDGAGAAGHEKKADESLYTAFVTAKSDHPMTGEEPTETGRVAGDTRLAIALAFAMAKPHVNTKFVAQNTSSVVNDMRNRVPPLIDAGTIPGLRQSPVTVPSATAELDVALTNGAKHRKLQSRSAFGTGPNAPPAHWPH